MVLLFFESMSSLQTVPRRIENLHNWKDVARWREAVTWSDRSDHVVRSNSTPPSSKSTSWCLLAWQEILLPWKASKWPWSWRLQSILHLHWQGSLLRWPTGRRCKLLSRKECSHVFLYYNLTFVAIFLRKKLYEPFGKQRW